MSFKLTYTGQQVQSYLDKVATGQAGGGTKDYNELEHIPVINQDLSVEGFSPIVNTYYKHMGITGEVFTQGVIYLYSGDTYKALDGEVPTKVSQLQNDSGYATTSQIPDVSDKANLSGGNEFVDGGNTFKDIGGTTQISGSNVWLQAVGAQGSASLVVETDNKNEVFKVEADSDNGIIHINRAISIEGDTGTSGKVLTSQGSGNAPAWTTPPTFSLSGTTLTLTL